MVLLRTYDERSVVYHRQGRIGTYAIFWNHEAIQAGATFALDDDDWIFPSYRESAIGLVRGMPVGDAPALVARPSRGLVEPGRLERRVDLRADRDACPARRRARVGEEAARRGRRRDGVLRRRRDERGRVPRRRELRGGDECAAGARLQQQPVGDLDADRGADARGDARRQGGRLRHPRRARRRARRARRVRGGARGGRARARRRRADAHRGACTTAPRRTRPPTTRAPTSTSRASRRSARTNASGASSASCATRGVLTDEHARRDARVRGR